MKPFRYGVFAKLVIGTFLSFFLLLRIEGTGECFTESSQQFLSHCSPPESKLIHTDKVYKLAVDIPGVRPRDLDVSVDPDLRTVKLIGNRKDDVGDLISCYQKSWQVDDSVNLESLVMELDNGVLTVCVPKEETKQKKKRQPKVRGSKLIQAKPRGIAMRSDMHEPPLVVDPISYDEQELLESVSVLTDEESDFWYHRM